MMEISPVLDPLFNASEVQGFLESELGEVLLNVERENEFNQLLAFRFEEGRISFQNLSTSKVESMSLRELHKQMEAGVIKAFLVDIDMP